MDSEKGAEFDHYDARAEVDRLQLTVRIFRIASALAEKEDNRS